MPKLAGMQEISLEEIKNISNDIKNVDEYSTECMANMQYCMKRDTDGTISFDFSHFRKIAKLARQNGKKLVIDSAIAFGDRFPENMEDMSKKDVCLAIAEYTKELTSEFGDCIERIDVLNSIFQRQDVTNTNRTMTSESYWKELFGENYGKEILDIVKKNSNNPNIKLGWNEFYLTHDDKKRKDFLEQLDTLDSLDVIGLQDAFRADEPCEKINSALEEIANACKNHDKKISVTELSAKIGRSDIENLNKAMKNGTYSEQKANLEQRIENVINTINNFSERNYDLVDSVHSRYSDSYDCNHIECLEYGHDIHTAPNTYSRSNILLSGKEAIETFTTTSQIEYQRKNIKELSKVKNIISIEEKSI